MRILVCLKQVPDTTEVKMSSEFTLERDFVAQVMNPADESALELGMKLRDAHGGSVTLLTMGPARAESMLREALSRGADEAVHLCDKRFAGADTLVTAACLKAFAERNGPFDLILCGKRAADGETGQVGPMLASLLDMACVVNATDVSVNGDCFRVRQLTEAGTLEWETETPALVTLCEWSHRLRLPTILGLRKAAKADICVLSAEDLGIPAEQCGLKASPTRVVRVNARPVGVRPVRKMSLAEAASTILRKEALKA